MVLDTWLVTGGGGFLGSNAGVFLRNRANAVALAREPKAGIFGRTVEADLLDREQVKRVVGEIAPAVILHAAAISRHDECERDPALAHAVNVDATRTLSEAADACGAKLIYISTDAVFSGTRGHYSETDEPEPFSVYGRTKLEGEIEALAYSGTLVIRTNFFGWSPSGSRSILEFFLNALEQKHPVRGYTDFAVTSIYVQSLLDAIWNLTECETRGVVHVASRDALSKFDFAMAVAEEFCCDPTFVRPDLAQVERGITRTNRDISLDVSKYEARVGGPAQSQREGLAAAKADMERLRRPISE